MQENLNTEITEHVDLLVSRAVDGDAEAFGQLYDLYINRIYRHIYYRVGNKEESEDLTQRVFINAWKAIGKYKKTASPFLAWLMRISHNMVVDFYRSKKDKDYLDIEIVAKDLDSNPERLAEANLSQRQIRKTILQLPDEQQQVIMMSFIEGFTYTEIASALGKSEGAIRVIQHRALKKMRSLIDKEKNVA